MTEPAPAAVPAPSRSLMAQATRQVLGRVSAWLGLSWIILIAVLAVLAPWIASSHPLLVISDRGWSSPLIQNLTPVDVILTGGGLLTLVLLPLRMGTFRRRFQIVLALTALIAVPALTLVDPPEMVVYARYRAMADDPNVVVVNTIIEYSPTDRLRDAEIDTRRLPPSVDHLMGTTVEGEDLLSRMIHACRIALAIGFIATGIAVIIGVIVGGLMGYYSGIVDLLGMRLVEVFSAIPTLFLLIACTAFIGRNLYIMMAIIGATSWVGYALFIRAEFLKLRQQDYVIAGRACGLPIWSILFKHMLPNGVSPVLVNASFGVASAILTESVLSFLGLGLVEEPSWGQMLDQARGEGGTFRWWLAVYPGMAIFLTVFAYNLVGEAIRDAIDPRMATSQTA